VNLWTKITLLGVTVVVGGLLLGTGYFCFNNETAPPYPPFDRIGGLVIYAMSIGLSGILASQWRIRGRRDFIWTGEWLGVTSSVLFLATAWLKFAMPSGLQPQLFTWLLAHCLVQCILSVTAVGLLVAKCITRFPPVPRMKPPRTDMMGYVVCAATGPIVYSQFCDGLFVL